MIENSNILVHANIIFSFISVRGDVWAPKTSLAPPNVIKVPVPSQETNK